MTKLSIVLAVSFSNIQHSFGLPTFFVAHAFHVNSEPSLELLRTKDCFKDAFLFSRDIEAIKAELMRFNDLILARKVVVLNRNQWCINGHLSSFVAEAYLKRYEWITRALCSENLDLVMHEVKRAFFHQPLDENGNVLSQLTLFSFRHNFSFPIEVLSSKCKNKFMQLSRLDSWLQYLLERNLFHVRQDHARITGLVKNSLLSTDSACLWSSKT